MLSDLLAHWRRATAPETRLRRSPLRRRLGFRLSLPDGPAELHLAGRPARWLATRAARDGGMHEPGLVRALIALRGVLGPGTATFYDVGMLHGYVALVAAAILRPPAIHGFEMNPVFADMADHTLALNPQLGGAVRLVRAGVADTARPGVPCAVRNFALRVDPAAPPDGFTPAEIDIVTLDAHAAATATIPRAIKIDVEGSQMSVLRGAERLLREARPVLLIETDGPGAANHDGTAMADLCLNLMERHGYETAFVDHRRWDAEPTVLTAAEVRGRAVDLERNGLLIGTPAGGVAADAPG